MLVGIESEQDSNFSATLTQGGSTKNLQQLPATPKLWAVCQQVLSPGDVKSRQCEPGELCFPAPVSRPDICARLDRISFRINSLRGSDVYRTNDLVKAAKLRQQAAALKYGSSSQLGEASRGNVGVKMRQSNEKFMVAP